MAGIITKFVRAASHGRQLRTFSSNAAGRRSSSNYRTAAAIAVGGGALFALGTHQPAHTESKDGAPMSEPLVDMFFRKTGFGGWVDWFNEPADRANCPKGTLLPDPPALPPGVVQRTLVLSLEDCLVHTEWDRKRGHRNKKRPGLEAFLAHVSQFYEVVIFTTALSSWAQPIAMTLQDTGYVQHALFKESCKIEFGRVVKDLSYLNR
jgi:import inner membrane translocase subunit TIM50